MTSRVMGWATHGGAVSRRGTHFHTNQTRSKVRPAWSWDMRASVRVGVRAWRFFEERRRNSLSQIQGGRGGWPTGNGKKLSNSQACCLAQLCLAGARFCKK